MRPFHMERDADPTGVSGTGVVAEGIQFRDGQAVLKWLTDITSLVIYDSVESLVRVHGHGGLTRLVWDVPPRDTLEYLRVDLGNTLEFLSKDHDPSGFSMEALGHLRKAIMRLHQLEANGGASS